MNTSTVSKGQSTLKAQWNAAAPVNSLPNELFVEIFLLAEPRPVGHCENTNSILPDSVSWAPLMLVCRHWKNAILSTPGLWRVIKIRKNLRWAELAVSRSQDAMLDIDFWFNTPLVATHPILLPVAERIAALAFFCMYDSCLAPALRLVNSAHSNLVELSLTRAGWEPRNTFPGVSSQSVSFCPQQFPAMTALTIEGVRVSLKDPQAFISQLRVLDVRECLLLCDPPILTSSTFLDILAGCASLEEACLYGVLSQFHDDLPKGGGKPDAQPGISIPKLRKLRIEDKVKVVSNFMSSLYVPPSVEVRLVGKLDSPSERSPGLFIPVLPLNWRQTLPVLDDVRTLFLNVGLEKTEIQLGASASNGVVVEVAVDFNAGGCLSRAAVDEVLQLFSDVPITSLTVGLYIGPGDVEKAEWSRLLAGFGDLETFAVITPGMPVPVFEALAEPQPGQSGDRVVCPKLRELWLLGLWWSDDTLESIIECVETRIHGGATALEKLDLELSFDTPKHFENAKRIFLSAIGEVFDGKTTFGYDYIQSDDAESGSESDDSDDSDDSD